MASYYKRGKFTNKYKFDYTWDKINKHDAISKFVKTLIIRGIGYRSFAVSNDLLSTAALAPGFVETLRPVYTSYPLDISQEITQVGSFEFSKYRYLVVRAGHTRDISIPLHNLVTCATRKKDRKLIIASKDKILSANLSKQVHNYRAPSVYTGRGVRIKHIKPLRKAGKKDKQRGKAF